MFGAQDTGNDRQPAVGEGAGEEPSPVDEVDTIVASNLTARGGQELIEAL